MSTKLKSHQNWNITKTEMLPKLKCHRTKCHQNWNVTKTKMSPKLKCHQNWNITKTESHQNWYVTKTEMSPKLQYQNFRDPPWLPRPIYYILLDTRLSSFLCVKLRVLPTKSEIIWNFFPSKLFVWNDCIYISSSSEVLNLL